MNLPNLNHEIELWKKGYFVIGIDEVGRGAFAGPLYVGGVIFHPRTNNKRIKYLEALKINDSKKLKPREREMLAKVIQNESLAYYISQVNVPLINRIGIGKATFCCMRNVVSNLIAKCRPAPDAGPHNKVFVLVDGFYVKYLKGVGLGNQRGIVNGDNISLSIAAASIIAKVTRDNHMRKLSAKYKAYGWKKNKGYGTLSHRTAIRDFGPTPFHRTAFITTANLTNMDDRPS